MTWEHGATRWGGRYQRFFQPGTGDNGSFRRFRLLTFGNNRVPVMRLCIVVLAVVSLAGCGKFQEQLDTAKRQIEQLHAETKSLSERLAGLDQEKTRLSEQTKLLAEKNEVLRNQVAALEKAKTSLEKDLEAARKSNQATAAELQSVKTQKADLEREVEALKKSAGAAPALPAEPKEQASGAAMQAAPDKGASPAHAKASPCDALLRYMRRSQAIVRQYKGEERTKMLQQVKQELEPHMNGAPEKALAAAEKWVNEMVRVWDNPRSDSAYILLSNKAVVLDTCHITPEEAGF